MFWPFIEIDGELTYCPLADFGTQNLREGKDIYGKAVVAQPLTAHLPLHNATSINGKIAIVERGACDFVTKVLRAQAAGAIAVVVANCSRENPNEAFVMDAGRRSDQEISSIRIPAMMVSYTKATHLFEQLRECYLDRRELSMTIKFLGAQTSAYVLEQIENAAKQRERDAQGLEMQHDREKKQKEVADLLRKRLGKATNQESECQPSVPSSPLSATSSNSSATSKEEPHHHRSMALSVPSNNQASSACLEDSMDTLSLASSSDPFESTLRKSFQAPEISHWCPMTTALLIMDVQNYFALSENQKCMDLCLGSQNQHRPSGGSSLEFYKRIKTLMVPTIQDILLACRACDGMEIVYSVVESMTRDGRERSRAHKHAGVNIPKGGFGAQVLPRVAPTDEDIVLPRTGANLFESTNADYVFRNLGVSHLVVVGLSMMKSIPLCVQTALDRGYQVTLIKDAITAANGEQLDELLHNYEALGCQVVHAAAFVGELHGYYHHYTELKNSNNTNL